MRSSSTFDKLRQEVSGTLISSSKVRRDSVSGNGGGEAIFPLRVVVKGEAPSANGKEDMIVLKVSLLAAGTQLEWEVLRSWKEFSQLHKDFKRYKSSMLSLPSKLLTTDRKRLQLWLDSVASSPSLSSSKEFYHFLSIGKTVELLSAHHSRPATRALEVSSDAGSKPQFFGPSAAVVTVAEPDVTVRPALFARAQLTGYP